MLKEYYVALKRNGQILQALEHELPELHSGRWEQNGGECREAVASILLPLPGMSQKGRGRSHLHAAVRLPVKLCALHPL